MGDVRLGGVGASGGRADGSVPDLFVRVAAAGLPESRGTLALVPSLSVIAFFAIGAAVLAFVDVEKGRKAARDAEAGLRLAPAE